MNLADKTVIVIGLGKSGTGLITFLDKKCKEVFAFDSNSQLKNNYKDNDYKHVSFYLGSNPTGEEEVDLVVISPGIPLEVEFVQRYIQRGIPIIGEVELAFQVSSGHFVGITGTNGKTTTTSLTGAIFQRAGFDTRIVGNIGHPIIEEVETADSNTFFITELSSFQLETIKDFKCEAATIINITPDHLNRHKTMDNYIQLKGRIYSQQGPKDFAVINYDDPIALKEGQKSLRNKIYTSVNENLGSMDYEQSIYIENGIIKWKNNNAVNEIIHLNKIFLKGKHNYENVLIAAGLAISFGIEIDCIAKTLMDFKGVEHRLEFVKSVNQVDYYNDSKGTNPDASIKAIDALDGPIILIAGGMDKKSNFDQLIQLFPGKVKQAIFLGETKELLVSECKKQRYTAFSLVNTMDEAVKLAYKNAINGDTVLLSPACASWDMYESFEKRGEHFKNIINELEVKDGK